MAISFVQAAKNQSAAAASLTVTLGSGVTAGNVVVAYAKFDGESDTIAPSMTGVTWTTLVGPRDHSGAATLRCYLWLGVVASGGATGVTFTNTPGSSSQYAAWVSEFSGVATSSFTDQTASNQSPGFGSSSADISGTVATTQADELLVAGYGLQGANDGPTAGSGYTLVHSDSTYQSLGQYRVVASTGNYACPITFATSRNWVCAFATLKGATAAAGGGVVRRRSSMRTLRTM